MADNTENAFKRGRAIRPLADRFWEKVDCDGPVPKHCSDLGACWVWTASTYTNGYGQIGAGRRGSGTLMVHRVSWELEYGEIPSGLQVLHKCDNKPCVRPTHLFLGTQLDNVRDMDAEARRKGVAFPGESHHKSKLTDSDVRLIQSSSDPTSTLAVRFKVAEVTIWRVRTGRSWRHLG